MGVAHGETKCASEAQVMPMKITKKGAEKLPVPDRRVKTRNSTSEPAVPIAKCKATALIGLYAMPGDRDKRRHAFAASRDQREKP